MSPNIATRNAWRKLTSLKLAMHASIYFLGLLVIASIPILIHNRTSDMSAMINFKPLENYKEADLEDEITDHEPKPWKTILFWHTWFGGKWSGSFRAENAEGLRSLGCPSFRCEFTYDKSRIKEADAVLFRFQELKIRNLPSEKSPNQRWIWLTREAPTELTAAHKALELDMAKKTHLINWTMTYHTNSAVVSPYGHFLSLVDGGKRPLRPNLMSEHQKTLVHYQRALNANSSIAEFIGPSWRDKLIRPKVVAWMSSHCKTRSGREKYVEELEKYIEVDKYGKCGTKDCGERNPKGDWCWEDVLKPKYMFYMAMENVFCEDYITEKAYLPLRYYMVPVVFGGADYSLFLPPGSYINARDYKPKDLADLLTKLSKDPEAYSRYHLWRGFWEVQMGSTLCELCHRLHTDSEHSYVTNMAAWRNENGKCVA